MVQNLGYEHLKEDIWRFSIEDDSGIQYQRFRTLDGSELRVAKLTGADIARILQASSKNKGKSDLLQDFLDWLNTSHNFLVCSPDLLAYATHEQYGSSSFHYHASVKRRVHSLLRGRTLVLDEYHQYDPFTLINIEHLISDVNLAPSRVLLLSATQRSDYFLDVPEIMTAGSLPEPIGSRTASREIQVNFLFNKPMPEPQAPKDGLALYIHNSVVENRSRCARARRSGIKLVQWDGTRKDNEKEELGKSIHLVMGTSAIEVGLDLDADILFTQWNLRWMTPSQITQRIGRIGRRTGERPGIANIYLENALESEINQIRSLHANIMTKNELNNALHSLSSTSTLNRSSFISHYYHTGPEQLQHRRLLKPNEELRYCFRPPGTLALFLDVNEAESQPFLYEKSPMLNRYEITHAMPEHIASLEQGWKDLCINLHMNLEDDFLLIHGELQKREWLQVPTGNVDDLKKHNMRKYYIKSGRDKDASEQII